MPHTSLNLLVITNSVFGYIPDAMSLPWLHIGDGWLHIWFSWHILNEEPDIRKPGSQEKVTRDPTRYDPCNVDGGFVWPFTGVGSSHVTTSRIFYMQ